MLSSEDLPPEVPRERDDIDGSASPVLELWQVVWDLYIYMCFSQVSRCQFRKRVLEFLDPALLQDFPDGLVAIRLFPGSFFKRARKEKHQHQTVAESSQTRGCPSLQPLGGARKNSIANRSSLAVIRSACSNTSRLFFFKGVYSIHSNMFRGCGKKPARKRDFGGWNMSFHVFSTLPSIPVLVGVFPAPHRSHCLLKRCFLIVRQRSQQETQEPTRPTVSVTAVTVLAPRCSSRSVHEHPKAPH